MKTIFVSEQESPIKAPKYCKTCDLAYEATANYCGYCGTELNTVLAIAKAAHLP